MPCSFLTPGARAAGTPASVCGVKLGLPVGTWAPAAQLCPSSPLRQEPEPHLIETQDQENPQGSRESTRQRRYSSF